MSIFGFTETPTGLGHFGTGVAHQFTITPVTCNLQYICDTVADILVYVEQIYQIVNTPVSKVTGITALTRAIDAQDKKIDTIFSAIADMRRELLRGNRDIGR